mgnify:FL=1
MVKPIKNMLFSIDLLRDIVVEIGGKNGSFIVDALYEKKHVNEFFIAKKLKLTINQTRNILYKLSDEGLVSSIRKKDKKKGWYTYFWTLNIDKALALSKKIIIKNIEQLEHQLNSRHQKRFYKCKLCGTEVTEENALLHDFTCQECGEVYELSDSSNIVNEFINQINKLKRKLEEINSYLQVIESKKIKKLEFEKRKLERQKTKKHKTKLVKKQPLKKVAKKKMKQPLKKIKHKTKINKKKHEKSAGKKRRKKRI